jgi:drug/metabolite transporter (DMT)-like permease
MSATGLALISAFCFASTQVTAKRGLQSVSVEASLVVSLGCAWVVIAGATLLSSPGSMELSSVAVFAVSGLITPGISRWASVTGVERLGPSISAPLQQGARPLLAVLGATLLLGEELTATRAAGVACVVVGAWTLGTVRGEVVSEASVDGSDVDRPARSIWRRGMRPGIVWPFLAASSYAISDILVKNELGTSSEPFLAATIGLGSAWIAWGLLTTSVPAVRKRLRFGPGIRWFVLSGFLAGVANLALYSALDKGDVSLVAPTVGSQPLMVFVLSAFLLRGIERIDRSTVFAGFLIVLGTALVSLG